MTAMRKAFTLVELMTVVAIMALLGVASVGGYNAMQRGIRERGAVASASALMRAAKERACVDRVPTAVVCYNVLLREASAEKDESAIVVGVMTALRRAGRISYRLSDSDELLYDEFGDLNLTYPCFYSNSDKNENGESHDKQELENCSTMKLYKFPTSEGKLEYSLVADTVWCTEANKLTMFSSGNAKTNCLMAAFYERGGSKKPASWKVGDSYAFEIGELRLPHGMVFEKSVPTSVSDISNPRIFIFDPENPNDETIDVNTAMAGASGKPEKFVKAGTATTREKENL